MSVACTDVRKAFAQCKCWDTFDNEKRKRLAKTKIKAFGKGRRKLWQRKGKGKGKLLQRKGKG